MSWNFGGIISPPPLPTAPPPHFTGKMAEAWGEEVTHPWSHSAFPCPRGCRSHQDDSHLQNGQLSPFVEFTFQRRSQAVNMYGTPIKGGDRCREGK